LAGAFFFAVFFAMTEVVCTGAGVDGGYFARRGDLAKSPSIADRGAVG